MEGELLDTRSLAPSLLRHQPWKKSLRANRACPLFRRGLLASRHSGSHRADTWIVSRRIEDLYCAENCTYEGKCTKCSNQRSNRPSRAGIQVTRIHTSSRENLKAMSKHKFKSATPLKHNSLFPPLASHLAAVVMLPPSPSKSSASKLLPPRYMQYPPTSPIMHQLFGFGLQ